MKNKSPAFTIMELLVVVIVIGILAAVVTVSYGGLTKKAHDNNLLSNIDKIAEAQEIYSAKNLSVAGKAYYYSGSGDGYDADLDFRPSEGNIIDVVVDSDGYCIRGYNSKSTYNSIYNSLEKESSGGACDSLSPSETALADYTGPKVPVAIVAAGDKNCVIASDNQAYCWGSNVHGEIGDGTTGVNRLTPTAVNNSGVLAGKTIKFVDGGTGDNCVIASDNQAYCWGDNTYGEIGDGTFGSDRLVPTAVDTSGALAGKTIKNISANTYHTCAIASDDQAYCWGYNAFGHIGDGTTTTPRLTPTAVDKTGVLAGKTIKAISVGWNHTCAIASDDQVYCWGSNTFGQIGDGTVGNNRLTPTAITGGALVGKTVKAISAGTNSTCVIASDNQAYCWGRNNYGQIGDGTSGTNRLTPTAVNNSGALAGKTIKIVVTAGDHTCAIASDDQVYCWGSNTYGEIGDGTSGADRLVPTAVDITGALTGKTVKSISNGEFHTCIITSDNQVYCWGYNYYGQIGDGTTVTPRLTPIAVSSIP